jgi:hypothetical protein
MCNGHDRGIYLFGKNELRNQENVAWLYQERLGITWNQVPIQFFGANLNCLGKIVFTDNPPRLKSNNVFIPYVSSKEDEQQKTFSSTLNAGIDAKIAVNSSLNLDATINPDFSQVDVDRQIINLDRFNILLPERRPFSWKIATSFQIWDWKISPVPSSQGQ